MMCSTLPLLKINTCERTLLSILKENIERLFSMNLVRIQASDTAYYCHPAAHIYSWTLLPHYSYEKCQVGLTICGLCVTVMNHWKYFYIKLISSSDFMCLKFKQKKNFPIGRLENTVLQFK